MISSVDTLAASTLPPRVRRILELLLAQLRSHLSSRLDAALDALEDELFSQAERARSNELQGTYMVNQQQVRKHRALLLPSMIAELESELANLRTPRVAATTTVKISQTLTLVADDDIDQDIVLREIARRLEGRHQEALHLLAQRLGVLAGSPALEETQQPLSPASLCRALRVAAAKLNVDLSTQLQLYRLYEQHGMSLYGELLVELGELLGGQGVLPGLTYAPQRSRPASARRKVARASQSPEAPAEPKSPGDRAQATPEMPSWARAANAPRPHKAASTFASLQRLLSAGHARASAHALDQSPGMAMPNWHGSGGSSTGSQLGSGIDSSHGFPGAGGSGTSPGGGGSPAGAGGAGGFGTSAGAAGHAVGTGGRGGSAATGPASTATDAGAHSGLDHGHRSRQGDAIGGGGVTGAPAGGFSDSPSGDSSDGATTRRQGSALSTGKLLNTLQVLQQQIAQGQAPRVSTSLAEVRQRTLEGLRRAYGADAELDRDDADTFELLDLLYHEIGREVRKGPASDLLGQLQVPVVQAALSDREFFLRPQHPARELLNAVAESGANWLGEDEIDPVLLQKLRAAVAKVLAEYTGDEAVFEQAHREVQDHFQVAARKAEVTERRHVEAARGRDRLELAKQEATSLIGSALAGRQPAPFIQALLDQAWADVLTLTRLRNGEESAEWQEVAGITTHIAEAVSPESPAPAPELVPRIERALVQVGYHGDEASVIAQRLSGSEVETPGSADLAIRIQARAKEAAADAPAKVVLPPRTAAEQASFESLRKQPFGTWFEFVHNQQGDVRRLRLSWFNPTSGHALFVNQRGQKVGEHTLDSVARLMARDQARIITEERTRLIDRAWQATMDKLRQMAGVGQ